MYDEAIALRWPIAHLPPSLFISNTRIIIRSLTCFQAYTRARKLHLAISLAKLVKVIQIKITYHRSISVPHLE